MVILKCPLIYHVNNSLISLTYRCRTLYALIFMQYDQLCRSPLRVYQTRILSINFFLEEKHANVKMLFSQKAGSVVGSRLLPSCKNVHKKYISQLVLSVMGPVSGKSRSRFGLGKLLVLHSISKFQ